MLESIAFKNALEEITLVLFTTLAPAGIACIMILSAIIIRSRCADERRLIERFLYAPIAVTLIGLVASATHLGNPSNALYALAGIGRSPLSNEVASGVIFLGATGIYWLTSFSSKNHTEASGRRIRNAGCIAVIVLGAAFLFFISRAYSTPTIISWNNNAIAAVPITNAFMAGPLLATTVLFAADRYNGRKAKYNLAGQPVATSKKCRILLLMSIVFFAICIVLYIYQLSIIDKTYNSTGLTIDRVPQFMVMICLFAILCVAAIIIEIKHLAASKHSPQIMSIAFILMASGIFIMRFGFYMSYTTVGISL